MNIREAIRQLAHDGYSTVSVICMVDSVDMETRTVDCSPIDGSAPLLGVNLQANQGSGFGIVAFPRVGSYVVVGFVARGDAGVVLLTDDVEKVEVVISEDTARIVADGNGVRVLAGDDTSAEFTQQGVVFNGGSFGGMVKVEALTDKLNELIDAFNGHTHTLSPGMVSVAGSATSQSNPVAITVPAIASKHRGVLRADYENEKVKH